MLRIGTSPKTRNSRWTIPERPGKAIRLTRDDERPPETPVGPYFGVFAMLMLVHAVPVFQSA
ncbi:hypothetical protein CJO78_09465 [Ralstonia solanacearum]|nr:hypothetical protein CJO78_09465 [Ralstonia solanacearum]AXW06017.1 hypothetical protein CJO82_09240 [Ralstonia solanacearum]AXW23761.1 hypothetical protein CJO86_09245 [Ralstonia solanacearum]AXW80693.1 hypothetical protein CJO98_09475 [Ralstonia solanacearum]